MIFIPQELVLVQEDNQFHTTGSERELGVFRLMHADQKMGKAHRNFHICTSD